MPIYAYKCDACGHAKDVLRKVSDPPLSTCPACGAEAFVKQVTAAGFQLKGSGWYVTDFRDGNKAKTKDAGKDGEANKGAEGAAAGEGAAGDKAAAPSADGAATAGTSKAPEPGTPANADKSAEKSAAKPAGGAAAPAAPAASGSGSGD